MSITRKASRLATAALSARQSPYSLPVTHHESNNATSSLASSPPRSSRRNVATSTTGPSEIESETKTEDIEDIKTAKKGEIASELAETSLKSRKRKATATLNTSPKKAKTIRLTLDTPHPAPANWEQVYFAIKEMRKEGGAPVDDMGCHAAAQRITDPKAKRFVTLVSLMLSSQTKDEVTHGAILNLRAALGELTVENVLAADESTISDAINKVGFWRRKTQYIRQAAQKIKDEFEGEIPNTLEGLCSLPGVGPKMAFLALQVAWDLNVGIGVDVHVHRITNRLGWHKPPTKEPEQTRLNLESWLPKELHGEINPLLVGFGQTICLPVGPRCESCTLSTEGLCPSARVKVKSRNKKATVTKPDPASPKLKIELEYTLAETTAMGLPVTPEELEVKVETQEETLELE